MPASDAQSTKPMLTAFDVTWKERAIVLSALAGSLVLGIALTFWLAPEKARQLLFLVPSSFFALGKFLPLAGLREEIALTPYELGFVIGVMDTCTVLFIVYSLQAVYRIRLVRRFFEKAQTNAGLVLSAYPWMRRFALIAVIMFVLFPISGTGAIGGTFLGVLLGLRRYVLIPAIMGGGFLGGYSMAFLAMRFGEAIQELNNDPALIIAFVFLLVALFGGMYRAHKKALDRVADSPAVDSSAFSLSSDRSKPSSGQPSSGQPSSGPVYAADAPPSSSRDPEPTDSSK